MFQWTNLHARRKNCIRHADNPGALGGVEGHLLRALVLRRVRAFARDLQLLVEQLSGEMRLPHAPAPARAPDPPVACLCTRRDFMR